MLDTIVQTIVVLPKPVLLHCEHGEDRTGLAVAAYRVVVSGWTKDEAMDEALKFGYRNWLNYGLNKTWRGVQ
jgi:protein tyrosine/serine phosphatase